VALISAFDLQRHPENIAERVACLELKLRSDAESLPLRQKFDIVKGHIMMMSPYQSLSASLSFDPAIYEGYKAAHATTKETGSLGMALLVMKSGDIVDVLLAAMPSAKRLPAVQGDWVPPCYRLVVSISHLTPVC
jgi:hypothetical protein